MGIRRYVFMSIFNCDKHPEVPLMNIKAATEQFLASSKVPHTTLRLCGFHQVRSGLLHSADGCTVQYLFKDTIPCVCGRGACRGVVACAVLAVAMLLCAVCCASLAATG
jgi:hypothetical protein